MFYSIAGIRNYHYHQPQGVGPFLMCSNSIKLYRFQAFVLSMKSSQAVSHVEMECIPNTVEIATVYIIRDVLDDYPRRLHSIVVAPTICSLVSQQCCVLSVYGCAQF